MALLLALHLLAPSPTRVCDLSGVESGWAAAVQQCIDEAPVGAIVEVPPGQYVLDRQLRIGKPLTLRTAGIASPFPVCRADPDRCAVFVAAPDLSAENGFVRLESTSDVTLSHVVLDGNREARLASPAAQACQEGRNRGGFNATALDCVRCALHDVVSRRALCGTAFEWTGAFAAIRHSTFADNGDGSSRLMWADGLTALYVPDSVVTDNLFADNSDIGLIVGHGARALIARNRVVQQRQHAFAGLMLDNFNSSDRRVRGDFRRAVITANTIECGTYQCGFGIQLGPHPWYRSPNIEGGEVTGNRISGAGVGINVDGAGTRRAPIAVYANTVLRVDEPSTFPLCSRVAESSFMDIAPDSVVNRRGDETMPARRRSWHDC
jgi:hypothetical protein